MCLLAFFMLIPWCGLVLTAMVSETVAGLFLPVLLDDDEMGMSLGIMKGKWSE